MLSRDYSIKDICSLMNISRSGYYKWKGRPESDHDINRQAMLDVVEEVHAEHPTHGYRWIAAYIRNDLRTTVSDNFIYKCCRHLDIKSESKHQIHYKPRKVKDKYPNLILSTWDTVDRPRQVIVSDMTILEYRYYRFETTFYFDVFTKEMLTYHVAERRGSRDQYIDGLEDVKTLLKGCTEPAILHTDQGSVFASMAYNELIRDTIIVRSMSRAGKPTDNPVNEALNGWLKEELMIDFKITECRDLSEVRKVLELYKQYWNDMRPCFAIHYDTPTNYRKKYYRGELPRKNTFTKRVLTTEPKFVQKRRKEADNKANTDKEEFVSTFNKEKEDF